MGSEAVLVAAIDFGTTYSGYAFSFKTDYDKSPINVLSQNFAGGSVQSAKVPTSVLFKPDKTFDCFGHDAEEKYSKMSEENPTEARRWYYFERFKMTLHRNETLSRDTVLLDQTNKKEMLAFEVFSAAIAFMKDHLMKTLRKRNVPFKDSDVKWVLTVPAIWDDKAKNFMREAAEKAGVTGGRLELVLEPEAASVYCLEYNKAHQTLSKDVSLLKPGTKFMTVDCGGGTIDISVFQLREDFALRHLHRPEGSADGGTTVDEAFYDFILELIGLDGATTIKRMEMLALRRAFERTKRSNPSSPKVAIEVPESVQLSLNDGISKPGKYAGKVSMTKNRLQIDLDIYKSFFHASATSITKYIQTVLDDDKVGHVDAILLAGGFSESDVIQEAVIDATAPTPSPPGSSPTPTVLSAPSHSRRKCMTPEKKSQLITASCARVVLIFTSRRMRKWRSIPCCRMRRTMQLVQIKKRDQSLSTGAQRSPPCTWTKRTARRSAGSSSPCLTPQEARTEKSRRPYRLGARSSSSSPETRPPTQRSPSSVTSCPRPSDSFHESVARGRLATPKSETARGLQIGSQEVTWRVT